MPTKVEVETNTEAFIDIWNQIISPDRVNLEVTHAEEALLTLAKEKCDSVLHLLLKLSHTDVLKQLAYIHAELLEGMARTRLRIYRESWCKQGHVETSESLDAIWKYGLVLVFDWCRENIERLLNKQMTWGKIPMKNLVRTGMGFFDEKANEFKKRLQEEVEIAKPFQVQAANTEQAQGEASGPQAEEFMPSEDYRSVTMRGENFTLTPQQAQIIQIIDEQRKTGHPDVANDYILETIGSPNSRLRDSFKNNLAAWKALVKLGAKKGTIRLNI